MKERAFEQKWLQAASALLFSSGLLLALGALAALAGVFGPIVDLIFWPSDGAPDAGGAAGRLMFGIAGGLMAGWGTTVWLIATRVYPRDPALARALILPGTIVWFLIDGLGSFVAGAPLNVAVNLVFLALFWWPLRGSRDL